MTRVVFIDSLLMRPQCCSLLELGAYHLVRTPNHIADLGTQVGSAKYKGPRHHISIKQRHLDAATRYVMDKACDRSVRVQCDGAAFMNAAARLRPAFGCFDHLCAFGIGYRSLESPNDAESRLLKLSASGSICIGWHDLCAAGFTVAEVHVDRDDAIGALSGRPSPLRTIPIGRIKANAMVRRAQAIPHRYSQGVAA